MSWFKPKAKEASLEEKWVENERRLEAFWENADPGLIQDSARIFDGNASYEELFAVIRELQRQIDELKEQNA